MTDCQFSRAHGVFGVLLLSFFVFFASAGCCLVGNLVAPLLNGLNDLLNDGSLSNGPHGGSDVGGGLRESESVGNGGSDVGSRDGVGNGGNGSNGGSSGISSVGRHGVSNGGNGSNGG